MTRAALLAFATLPLLTGCGSADPSATLDTVRMTEAAQIEAMQAKDLAGTTKVYASKASLVMPGSAPVAGTAAIRAQFQKLLADPNFKVDYKAGPGWASGGADLAVTTGTATLTTTDAKSGKPVTSAVDYQTVWHKGDTMADPGWTIVSDYAVARAGTEVASAN